MMVALSMVNSPRPEMGPRHRTSCKYWAMNEPLLRLDNINLLKLHPIRQNVGGHLKIGVNSEFPLKTGGQYQGERDKSWTPVADPRRLAPGPGSLSWQGFEKTTHCTEDGEGNYGSIKKTGELDFVEQCETQIEGI